MKKIVIVTMVLFAILLAACGSASNWIKIGSTDQSLSSQTELLIGTLKLEGTDQTITKAQASELLTLWEGMSALQSSSTTAQMEVNALITQIKENMTSKQLQTIVDMKLTSQDAVKIEQQNVSIKSLQTVKSSQSSDGGSGPPDGGGDSFLSGTTGGITGTSRATTSGTSASLKSTSSNQVFTELIHVLIKLLKQKIAS